MLTAVYVILGIVIGLFLLVGVIVAVSRRRFVSRIERELGELRAAAEPSDAESITEADLDVLPEPVRRYLRFAGVVGRPRFSHARLRQDGEFRIGPDKPWLPLHATQELTARPPGFLWDARIELSPHAAFWIRDRYLEGRGHMYGTLAGVLPIIDEAGTRIDQGSYLRFLGEGSWMPTVFLEDYVDWEPIDDRSARLVSHVDRDGADPNDRRVQAVVHFDEEGALTRIVAQRYYSTRGEEPRLETWTGRHSDYIEVDGVRIPSRSTAAWSLDEDEFEYVRIHVVDAELQSTSPGISEPIV